MNWDKFIQKLRKEMPGYQSPVEVDDIWQSITSNLDALHQKKKRNRVIILWLTMLGLVFLTTIAFFVIQSEDYPRTIAGNAKDTQPEMKKRADSNDQSAKKPSSNSDTPHDIHSGLDSDIQRNSKSHQNNIPPKQKFSHGAPNASNEQTSLLKNNKNPNSSAFQNPTQNKRQDFEKNDFNSTSNSTSTLLNGLNDSIPETDQTSEQNSTQTLANADLTSKDLKQEDENKTDKKKKTSSKKKSSKKPFHYTLDIQGGLSYAIKNLNAKDEKFNSLLQSRQSSEKSLETRNFALRLGIHHRSGWEFYTGLEQSRIAERFDYQSINIQTENVIGVQSLRIDLNGDTTKIYGEITRTRTTTLQKKIYNTYKLLDIPLILAYQKDFKEFKLGLQAGVLMNISLRAHGQILAQGFNIQEIGSSQSSLFKSRIGLGYYLGAYLSRPVTSRFEWSISPFARFYPKNFSPDSQPISQKYTVLGTNFGLIYHF